MRKNMIRIVCLILVIVMVLSFIPVFSKAAEIRSVHISGMEQEDPDELLIGYMYRQSGFDMPTFYSAGDNLSGFARAMYNGLKPKLQAIAKNGGSTIVSVSYSGTLPDDMEGEFGKLVTALASDMPYDLYWFDKTENTDLSWSGQVFEFSFPVINRYRGGSEYSVNSSVSGISKAASNAAAIVAENASKSDQAKLEAYRDKICSLVEYDFDAAENQYPYRDAWQLIYVFDGDASTNVVCEGYSKAFKYLCDLSSWDDDLECLLVTGVCADSSGLWGDHMWNVVRIDGTSYLADVTNCDSKPVGWDVFLKGAEKNNGIYYVNGLRYQYDSDTTTAFTSRELALSAEDYMGEAIPAPQITAQPSNQTADEGTTAKFTVTATGDDLTYQWQKYNGSKWSNCTESGYNTRTLSIKASRSSDGYQFRCIVKNDGGSVTSQKATLTVRTAPVITTQPAGKTVWDGTTAKFTVAASGSDLTYQWQLRKSSTAAWTNCTGTGCTTNTFSIKGTLARNGYQLHCIVSNDLGTVTSNTVTLKVKDPQPVITTQPVSQSVVDGTTVQYTVAASGPDLTYQWQLRKSSTASWTNCTGTGCTTSTFSIKATLARNGYQLRCVVKNSAGSATSGAASLTVTEAPPVIKTQPVGKTAAEGTTVKFTVAATGSNLTYQWQQRKNSAASWVSCTDEGSKTNIYPVKVTAAKNGYQYRCVVKNSVGKVGTKVAELTLLATPRITVQPKNQGAAEGTTVKFTVTATGGNLTYQWQQRKSSTDSWANCTSTGYNTNTFPVKITAARSGYQYRCVIKNTCGKVISSPAVLTMTSPVITVQPKNVSVDSGETAKFVVKATGTNLTYQWQVSKDGGKTWNSISSDSAKKATYSFTGKSSLDGFMYRCVVRNESGKAVSNPATFWTY